MSDFKDKVVIVTGASSGIGRATAVQFATREAKVVLVGRNKDKLAITEKECISAGKKENVLVVCADLMKLPELKTVVDETVKAFNQIDVLVNNAGGAKMGGIAVTTPEIFDEMILLNTRAPFFLIQYCAPYLEKTHGSIVNVSSIAGLRGQARLVAYGMAKAALDQLTRSACAEFGPKGIRCNGVNPGVVPTDFAGAAGYEEAAYEARCKQVADQSPARRTGTTDDLASVIVFLASNKSAAYVHGANLVADGGLTEVMG